MNVYAQRLSSATPYTKLHLLDDGENTITIIVEIGASQYRLNETADGRLTINATRPLKITPDAANQIYIEA